MDPKVKITKPVCGRCSNTGDTLRACSGCHLILYCNRGCQKAHWPKHKHDCQSPLNSKTWVPRFEAEKRAPAWAPESVLVPHELREGIKIKRAPNLNQQPTQGRGLMGLAFNLTTNWFYNDMPAIDILCLAKNEGVQRTEPLNLLFAELTYITLASGDLGDVVKTVAELPDTFAAPLHIVINDEDEAVMSRNIMLLLLALSSNDPQATAEIALHFWYNNYWPDHCVKAFEEQVIPLLRNVLDMPGEASDLVDPVKSQEVLHRAKIHKWKFGESTLKASLTQLQGFASYSIIMGDPLSINGSQLKSFSTHKPWNGEGIFQDEWDGTLISLPPSWRVAYKKFFEDKVVLPHGYPRTGSWQTNSSLSHPTGPPLEALANPLRAWTLTDVMKTSTGGADKDIYGKLFYYVRNLFEKFIRKLQLLKVDFEVHICDAKDLSKHFVNVKFDRIHASNLGDDRYMGIERMLKSLSPLLKSPSENPNATLIALHRSIFDSLKRFQYCKNCNPNYERQLFPAIRPMPYIQAKVEKYMEPLAAGRQPNLFTSLCTAAGWTRMKANYLVMDQTRAWNLYKKIHHFKAIGIENGVSMRHNTIVEAKPMELKLSDQLKGKDRASPQAQAEFDMLLAMERRNDCRYVEWQKVDGDVAFKTTVLSSGNRGRHGATCY
ncbi:putative MYND-type zinc finger protein samB [Seiridium unicorne]|uniref:MYND-type zinc finger protein samB n=1 Tax=Seiridium unicorne TaxID=138068 RepID=A0ABR2UX82_9PEZI